MSCVWDAVSGAFQVLEVAPEPQTALGCLGENVRRTLDALDLRWRWICHRRYWVKFNKPAIHGDSGAPVWAPAWAGGSNASIGLVTAGRPEGSFTETLVEPLLHPPNLASSQVVGILHN